MAFDEALAQRVRGLVPVGTEEKKMFGGLCFMWAGHMACGIVGNRLMVRVGPDGYADALAQPHVTPMDFTGRPLTGMVYVNPPGLVDDRALAEWVTRGAAVAATLPDKPAPGRTKTKRRSK